jgi:hypothetical protein
MEYLSITPQLRADVRMFIKKTNLPREQQNEFRQFSESLRKGLAHAVTLKTSKPVIENEFVIQRTRMVFILKAYEAARTGENTSFFMSDV